MAELDFTKRIFEQVVQLIARSEAVEIWLIFLLRLRKIETVMVRVIKKVSLHSPRFVILMLPHVAWLDVNLHRIELQRPFARLWFGAVSGRLLGVCDGPLLAFPIEQLVAVRRN